ncbi:hypothetical protein ACJX0J_039960, partial [Zea mays]
ILLEAFILFYEQDYILSSSNPEATTTQTLPSADQLTFQFCFLFLFWILEYIPKWIYRNLEITGCIGYLFHQFNYMVTILIDNRAVGFDILNLLLVMRVGLAEPQPAEGIQT